MYTSVSSQQRSGQLFAMFKEKFMRSVLLEQAGSSFAALQCVNRQHSQSPVYTPEMFKQLQEWVQPARVELLLTELWSQNDDNDTTNTATPATALTASSSSDSAATQLLHTATTTTATDLHSAVMLSRMGDTTGGSIVNWYISAQNDSVLTAIEPLSSGAFSALLVDGIPANYTDQITMLLLGGGSSSSGAYTFRCGGLQYPIPQEACQLSALSTTAATASTAAATAGEHSDHNSVMSADAQVSVLDNLLAQRGVARHSMPGVSNWLLNSTLNLFCNSTTSSISSDSNTTLYWFSNSYSSATGLPTAGSSTASTIAAAVAVLLLNADGPEGASEYPPISHAVMFVLMICELIFALGIGVSCFVFSLILVRKLQEDGTEPRPFAQGWIAISKSTSFDRHAGRGRARSDSGSSQESSSRNAHTNVGGYVPEDGSPERSASLPVHNNSPYTASNSIQCACSCCHVLRALAVLHTQKATAGVCVPDCKFKCWQFSAISRQLFEVLGVNKQLSSNTYSMYIIAVAYM
eukprot:14936-Heterococcus_DN1.PRE.3